MRSTVDGKCDECNTVCSACPLADAPFEPMYIDLPAPKHFHQKHCSLFEQSRAEQSASCSLFEDKLFDDNSKIFEEKSQEQPVVEACRDFEAPEVLNYEPQMC